MTGNVFADGVVNYMLEHGINKVLCCVTGEFYLDFLDKVITLIALVIVIRLRRLITGRMDKNGHGTTAAVLAVLMTAGMAAGLSPHAQARTDAGDVDFYSYVQTLYSSENGLPCGEANDIVQTKDGVLWIGTYSGLYRYSGTEFRPMNEFRSVKNVNCMYVDEEGRLWIGTNDSGLSLSINEKISTVLDINSGLPSNSVRSIVKSSDGYYYVGTSGIIQILELKSGLQLLEQMPQIVYAHSMSAEKTEGSRR